jgi:inositol 1,4,5-triphosphate receptor type 1/inositol 1,4,5-triphosphate receptor type 3
VCEQLNRIDIESQRIYGAPFPVIRLEEFITNIIYLNINNPHCLKDELRIFFLKVLGRIITEKNLRDKTEQQQIDYWTPEYWSDYKKQIREAQLMLMNCGAAELICQLLKEPSLELRIALTNELLIFGVSFLLGGNSE